MLFARGGDKEKVGCGDKPGLSKIVAVGKVKISPVISDGTIPIMIDLITALSRLSHRLRRLSTTPIRIKYYMY